MVRYSRELALDDYEFEHFVRGTWYIEDDLRHLEAIFVAYVAGRLGLRAGEILHMQEDWINWRDRRIEIPYHQDCNKGEDGGICGHCRQGAKQRAEYSKLTLAEARLKALQERLSEVPNLPGDVQQQLKTAHILHIDSDLQKDALERQIEQLLEHADIVDDTKAVQQALAEVARSYQQEHEITYEEARDLMWQAKTETASRSVPFGWNAAAEITIEQFFDVFDEWDKSMSALNRRLDEALRNAHGLDEDSTTLHGLRATSASHLAGKGISAPVLKAMFGWSQLSTARRYIETSSDNTARQLEQAQVR